MYSKINHGKIIEITAKETGEKDGRTWERITLVVEETVRNERFGDTKEIVALTTIGERVKQVEALSVGDYVNCSAVTVGRNYDGRWYNDCRLVQLEKIGCGSQNSTTGQQTAPEQNAEHAPTTASTQTTDDLPF